MTAEQKNVTACIIDDDTIFTYGFNKLVQINGLFGQIMHFNNGLEAMEYLSAAENAYKLPDVIFVDINMPVMNGWEFVKKFEEIKSQLGKKIAVYIISSSVDLRDIAAAKNNLSVSDYILKPINGEQLTNVFNALDTNPDLKKYN